MGSVRFTERYFKSNSHGPASPVTDDEFWKCQNAIDEALEPCVGWFEQLKKQKPQIELLGLAGTATAVASWLTGISEYDREVIDHAVVSRGDVHRLVEELKWRTIPERQQMTGVEEKRADVLLAGAMILWRTMEILNISQCRVSTRGLRFGVLFGTFRSP